LAAGLVLLVAAAALDKRVAGASDRCGAAIWWQPLAFHDQVQKPPGEAHG